VQSSLDAEVVVIYQRCTHLGCRVPFCKSSQWFECPCHGARFDRVGERRDGPAPRGLDLMPATVTAGHLLIDSGTIVTGLPVGTNTTHQSPSGPFCVGGP
jgi:cytochrome b6-f complex iron-sulfur subunit